MSQPSGVEQRNYFRVKTELPLRVRGVEASERARLESSILHRDRGGPSELDPDLARWLDRIEAKIDRLLLRLDETPDGTRPIERVPVVLSGSGIMVPRDRLEDGFDSYLVELELPGPPAQLVTSIASVVPEPGAEGTPLSFDILHAEDREAIVRFTFVVEREQVRSRRARA